MLPVAMRERATRTMSKLRTRLRSKAFKDAFTEVAVTVGTATLPVWFFPFVALFIVGTSFASRLLDDSISGGELFLFCTSLVGPLLYTLFHSTHFFGSMRSRTLRLKVTSNTKYQWFFHME